MDELWLHAVMAEEGSHGMVEEVETANSHHVCVLRLLAADDYSALRSLLLTCSGG